MQKQNFCKFSASVIGSHFVYGERLPCVQISEDLFVYPSGSYARKASLSFVSLLHVPRCRLLDLKKHRAVEFYTTHIRQAL